MTWKRHLRAVNTPTQLRLPQPSSDEAGGTGTSSKYASYLPEVYAGHPNRIQRYYQYDDMDRDSDVNAALDTIADFCTQSEEQNEEPFKVEYTGEANETEMSLIKEALTKWVRLNDFRAQLWYIFRHTIKNGDAFFLRDPETGEWQWQDHFQVEMVKVNDEDGKKPEEYFLRGLEYNKREKFGTKSVDPAQYRTPFGTSNIYASRAQVPANTQNANVFSLAGANRDPRQLRMISGQQNDLLAIDADHMIHLSLSVGMDLNWPFGQSILEPVFKVYKQKEMLEDAIIIYRVQRAPERRIFYIDTGTMPPNRAKAHIEQIKNEIHQRRIPNRTGGGSSVLDAAYNPLCLALDTKVPLLDGRTLTIAELAEEYRAGKENWAYSCHPVTGEIMPGNITWAGVTRRDAKVIKLHLDNGETVTCTPDHKIPVLGRGFVEAKDLTPEDSLIAFNTRQKNIDRKRSNVRTYTQVFDHVQKDWVFAHRMVGDFFRRMGKHQEFTFLPEHVGRVKQTIHHKDFDRYNNDPRNLVFMDKEDHVAFHVFRRKTMWERMPKAEADRVREKISNSLRAYYEQMSPEDKERFSKLSSARNKAWIARKREEDPEGWREWRDRVGEACSDFYKRNPNAGTKRVMKAVANGLSNYRNQSLIVTPTMMRILVDLVKAKQPTRPEAAAMLSADETFLREVREANPPQPGHANKIDYDKVSPMRLDLMVEKSGYSGWRDFTRKVAFYNHRVVRIEEIDEPMDVGTITIDGKERWHPHHTFAIASGIFVKNSVLEDYFIAQGSEGRGSKVETLPGGELVGEIGDLLFFSKKLARGLRIPPSYLSLGEEEGNAGFNDGKLGQALIQEFRFNKYCMRLQQLLAPSFDQEFKRHLRDQGIEIDPSLFNLTFCPPQNFSSYRQIEMDVAQVGVYTQLQDNRRLSERFKLKRFLNLTEEELLENEKMWAEENAERVKKKTGSTPAEMEPGAGLDAVGIRPPPGDSMDLGPMSDDAGLEGGPEGGPPAAGAGGGPGTPPPSPGGGGGGPSIGINPSGGPI